MMLSESDLYNSNTEPNNNVNPKSLGAMWINYSNGRHYICSNNTMNNNTWLDPIGILTNELNSNINNLTNDTNNRINTINSNINNLTNDTNNRINSNQNNINVTNRRIDELNVVNSNNINSINRKINEINTRIDNINPNPMVFTTYRIYDMESGPYKQGVSYTNMDNKPMCIILCGTNGSVVDMVISSMGAVGYNSNIQMGTTDNIGNTLTGIIIPGAVFSIGTTSPRPSNVKYMVIT